jgi:hypothetical protein
MTARPGHLESKPLRHQRNARIIRADNVPVSLFTHSASTDLRFLLPQPWSGFCAVMVTVLAFLVLPNFPRLTLLNLAGFPRICNEIGAVSSSLTSTGGEEGLRAVLWSESDCSVAACC